MTDTARITERKAQLEIDPSGMLIVLPWHDPVVDRIGFNIRGSYVETFWLGILGPTSTWLLRRIDSGFDVYPEGYELNLGETAAALGLTFQAGKVSPFVRSLQRCVMFGAARASSYGVEVRRFMPPLNARNLNRLPEHLRRVHNDWLPARTNESDLLAG